MELVKGICHNNMYTVAGYTINQINYDDDGAYRYTISVEKDYYVPKEDGKLIVNTIYKEVNQYVQHVRNGPSCNILFVEPSKVHTIERCYRRNKSFPGLRHMVVKVKYVDNMCYEDFFCIVDRYDKTSLNYKLPPHGNSTKKDHPYNRTS